MFFVLSKVLDAFLSPLTWSLVLLAAAVPWRRRAMRRWRRRRAFAVAGLAILFVASNGYVSNALEWSVEQSAVSTYRPDVIYDAVIVLGGIGDERVWKARGEPSYNENVERIIVARRLLAEGKVRLAIVSGGPVSAELAPYSEARQLAGTLRAWGIAEDRIVLEDRARNTRENALYTKEIVRARGLGRVLVVTSAFHVPRSVDCFRAVDLDVDFLPTDYRATPPRFELRELVPRAGALATTSAILREIFGKWIYRARGYGS